MCRRQKVSNCSFFFHYKEETKGEHLWNIEAEVPKQMAEKITTYIKV